MSTKSFTQSIPLSLNSFENDLRVLALQGRYNDSYSFTQRPYSFSKKFSLDTLYKAIQGNESSRLKETKVTIGKNFARLSLLPISATLKFTSGQPYGWSDAALMPINGLQQLYSVGVYGEVGPFSIQYKPEFLVVNSKPFETTPLYGPDAFQGKIKKYLHGQSRLALNVGAISAGLSTENIWWGPGQFTSLLMSNNAPGFFHATINTRRPLKTPIGNFEFQLIGGLPKDDRNQSDEIYSLRNFYQVWGKDPNAPVFNKYINGLNLSYSPKFLPTLTLGFNRAFISGAGNTIFDVAKEYGYVEAFLPILNGIFKEKRILFEDSLKWNQLASVYARVVLPKAKAEVYFEYGWNDYAYNLRDILMSPTHSAAFMVGVKKIAEINKNEAVDFSVELTQMGQQADALVRDAGAWYIHWFQSNYSNYGQVLGAGTGRGSNSLISSVTYRNGFKQLGLLFESINRDPSAQTVQWHDMSLGFIGRIQLKQFILNTRLSPVFSNNYGWSEGNNKKTFMGMMGLSYFF